MMNFLKWGSGALTLFLLMNVAAAQTQPGVPPWLPKPGALPQLNMQVRTLEVRDVAFGTPGVSQVKVGRMAFSGFVSSGERVRAERIDLENVVTQRGTHAMEIPAIVITGADLPMPLFRALTEGAGADDWAGLLAQTSLDQVSIAQIIQRDPSANLEATLKGFMISGLKDGIVGSARLAEAVATAVPPGDPEKVEVRLVPTFVRR